MIHEYIVVVGSPSGEMLAEFGVHARNLVSAEICAKHEFRRLCHYSPRLRRHIDDFEILVELCS